MQKVTNISSSYWQINIDLYRSSLLFTTLFERAAKETIGHSTVELITHTNAHTHTQTHKELKLKIREKLEFYLIYNRGNVFSSNYYFSGS